MYFDLISRRWVYAPDGVPGGGGQEPPSDGQQKPAQPAPEATKTFSAEYVGELREEAKQARLKLKEAQDAIGELQKQAGDSKALGEKLGVVEAQIARAAADLDAAQKANQVMRLAVKAGIDPDVAALLDLSKIDLTDEKKVLETLSKLKGSAAAGGGGQPRPGGNGVTEDWRAQMFGARKTNIFGG